MGAKEPNGLLDHPMPVEVVVEEREHHFRFEPTCLLLRPLLSASIRASYIQQVQALQSCKNDLSESTAIGTRFVESTSIVRHVLAL